MNKDFMSQIYEALYTDPIYDIVASKNTEYKELNRLRSKVQDKFITAASDDVRELHDKLVDIINEQTDIIAKELYLQGMEDRDKMLQ